MTAVTPPAAEAALLDALRDLLVWARTWDRLTPAEAQRELHTWTETYAAVVRRLMEER
jgi:hypothetical protein